MIKRIKKLKQAGILGMNQRNSQYALKYNPRSKYPLVDNKLKTKQLASALGIPTPKLLTQITSEHQIQHLERQLDDYEDFVIKPAHGAGGDGILVFTNQVFGRYRLINGALMTTEDLKYHLSCLLAGAFSLGGHPDVAMIEQRVVVDNCFSTISYEGVPDIRVITLLGYPAMAMLRLPTRMSGGKANLHQGAIGVGIDLSRGKTLGGVLHHEIIACHPDTLNPTADIMIPYFNQILTMAASTYEITGLGYLGVDIVLDKHQGPLLLELNARPGLNIQIANRKGLLKPFQAIEAHHQTSNGQATVSERVAFSQNRMGVITTPEFAEFQSPEA